MEIPDAALGRSPPSREDASGSPTVVLGRSPPSREVATPPSPPPPLPPPPPHGPPQEGQGGAGSHAAGHLRGAAAGHRLHGRPPRRGPGPRRNAGKIKIGINGFGRIGRLVRIRVRPLWICVHRRRRRWMWSSGAAILDNTLPAAVADQRPKKAVKLLSTTPAVARSPTGSDGNCSSKKQQCKDENSASLTKPASPVAAAEPAVEYVLFEDLKPVPAPKARAAGHGVRVVQGLGHLLGLCRRLRQAAAAAAAQGATGQSGSCTNLQMNLQLILHTEFGVGAVAAV